MNSNKNDNKTLTAKRVAMEIDITWEMRRYGDEYKLKQELYNLNHFVPQRQDLDLTHRLTFATSTLIHKILNNFQCITFGYSVA